MNCIGIDVSKQQLVTYDGVRERTFPNTKDLKELAAFLQAKGPDLTVVFEPTGTYARFLESLCQSLKIRCWRVNPRVLLHLREVSQGRSKTDRTDAELLWQYGQERGQQLWEALSYDPTTPGEVLVELEQEIRRLKAREQEMFAQAERCIREDEQAQERYRLLRTIPRVGRVTALVLLALFRRYPGANRSQIVALVGLDAMEHRSGSSGHGKARISKRGDGFIRKVLYKAALAAVRVSPIGRNTYCRLKEKGKPEKVARVAAARKLLLLAHAVYRTGQPYRAFKASGA
ncbi:transposase [Candidatus Bipolaricaulota bacterium]|nr:transposase [Candidatus Bipolaricaulota bacterium]